MNSPKPSVAAIIQGIPVTHDPAMPDWEVLHLVREEIARWKRTGKSIAAISIVCDGKYAVVRAAEKSPIRRIRRITGYLSDLAKFNSPKRAEEKDRAKHWLLEV